MAIFAISPGVYSEERLISDQADGVNDTTGAIIVKTNKGPLELTLINNRTTLLNRYGNPDITLGYEIYEALAFLAESSNLWVKRAVKDAYYSHNTYYADRNGDNFTANLVTSIPGGSKNDYQVSVPGNQLVKFAGDFVTANSIIMTAVVTYVNTSGVETVADISVTTPFNTDSDTTLADFAADLEAELDSLSTDFGTVVSTANRSIEIRSPAGFDLAILDIDVTDGASQTTASIEDLVLFNVYSQNPGSWANSIGTKIASFDNGVPHRVSLTFSAALVTSNIITVTINGTALSGVNFATSSDNTMSLVAAAIKSHLGGSADAIVTSVGGGTTNDREIIIVAPDSEDDLVISAVVTAGASQATAAATTIVSRIPTDNTFVLEVYNSSTPSIVLEKFTVSLKDQLDGFGAQQNIEEVINSGPSKSNYIRVAQSTWSKTHNIKNTLATAYMTGAVNGTTPTSTEILESIEAFKYRESVDFRVFINAGLSTPSIQNRLASLVSDRRDSVAILDLPSSVQATAAVAVDYRKTKIDINSTYVAIYTPDVQVRDIVTDKLIYVPPSGYVAGVYARTDRLGKHLTPAGLARANLAGIVSNIKYRYLTPERDILFLNQVNYLMVMNGGAEIPVWTAETLISKPSPLSNIGIRRMLIEIQLAIVAAFQYNVHQTIDGNLTLELEEKIRRACEPYVNASGIEKYAIISDDRINSAVDKQNGIKNIEVVILPILPAKVIKLLTTITNSGANFEELSGVLDQVVL